MSVHFMFTGDNKDLLRKAQESRKGILEIDKQAKETSRSMETSFGSMGAAIAAFFTAQQASAIVNKIIEVRGEFQKFKAVLSNTLGSDQKAQSSMGMLTDFASKTPFQVNELTASFVKLANQGFTPAYDEMMKLGDLASSTGKGFDQLAEAIIDAQTGEMERLKEFGIRASKDGDKVTFTFKEQQTTVENSAKAIREYILSLGAMEGVTGANAKIAATLTGQVSNLEDSITSMYNKIGQQHEGLLSDAVGGAATLVENDEEVGAALAVLIVSYGAYKAVTLGLVAMERSQANIKYTQEAAELAKLLPIKEAAINADIRAAVAKGTLTTAQAEAIMSLRAESAANLQALQAVAAKAAAEKVAAKAVYESSLARELSSKQMTIQRREELAAVIATGNAEQITAAKGSLANAKTEEHIAVKGRKIAADRLSVASTNAESTAKAVNDVTTKSGTLSDIQATKAKGLLAIATKGLAAAFNMIKGPLIIAAIAGIAYAVYKLITADTAAEKAQKNLNEEREKSIQLKQELTSKTDGLISKINSETGSVYSQVKAYKELLKLYPKLGNMSFEEFKNLPQEQQQKMFSNINEKREIDDSQKAYEANLKRIEYLKNAISSAAALPNNGFAVSKLNEQLDTANQLAKSHKEEIDKIKEAQWEANTPVEEKVKHYENVKKSLVSERTEIEATLKKSEDVASAWMGMPDIINNIKLDALNKQIDETSGKIDSLTGKGTPVVQNKSYWEKKKKTAEDNLGKLPDTDAGSKAWKGYTAEIQEAEKALSKYSVSSNKDATSRLKAQQDLSRSILDSELKLQAGRISAMEEGKSKRIAIAKQEYQETLATIRKEKEEYEKNLKETGDKKDPAVLSTFDNRESAAGDKKNTDLAKIDKEYAEEYKERTKALTDVFLNEEERKLAAVKDRYSKERKWADEQLTTGGMTTEEHKSYTTTVDQAQMKENYNTLLSSLNDFKQQEKNLREKWDTDIAAAVEMKDAYLVSKLMEGKDKALSALNSQMLQESAEWMRLFGNLDTLTVDELNNLIDSIQKQLDSGTLKLNPVDMKALMDSLNQAKDKVAEKNPFTALAKSSGEMKAALSKLKQAEDDGLTGEALDEYKTKVKNSAENVKKSINAIGDAYGQVSDVMRSAADLISMVDEGVGETINNALSLGDAVMNIGQVVASAVVSFAAGMNTMETASVILLIIKAVILAVMAALALFNGDKKHEKKIKNMQEQVDDLSRAYDRLGEAIEDAYSTDKADLIDKESENLRKQNELIQQQIKEEEDKKKTDKDKVKDWQNTIEDNNRKIEENSKKGRVEAIMGSDIKSAIDEFAQAYADAWAKGEKAAGKSADIVKSLIRTSIIEMLKKDLKPEVEAFMTFLSGAMADGIIDASEQQIIDTWEKKLEGIADSSLAGKEKWLKDDEPLISSDSIADTITEGLADGKSGFKDFAGSFEDMMKTAVLNSLKTKYLEGPLREFSKKFTELSESGGQLTEAEIEELRGMYADIIDGAKVQFDGMKDIAGLDFSGTSDNSLKGTFAKASEESVGLLAGQTGATRRVMEDIENNMQPIREQMQFIYDLQKEGWKDVKAIRDLTTKIDKNTEQVASNTRMIHDVASKVADNTRRSADALDGGRIDVNIKGM